jgi:Relaxase/Mobilisation nuclease domain
MIPKIHKHTGSAHLVKYLLKATKESQVVDASVFTATINRLIASEEIISDVPTKLALEADLNKAFARINGLNPSLKNNMTHLMIGFAPDDGELSAEFKGQIARDIVEQMGYGNTYWVAVAHGRDDPEHDHVHEHDHMHILAARIDTNGRTISDSWDFAKVSKILRDIEQRYELTPFIPYWEREYVTPEVYWMLEVQQEEERQYQTKTKSLK